jgi:hypothetical protein
MCDIFVNARVPYSDDVEAGDVDRRSKQRQPLAVPAGWAIRAIAQITPTISRAIAVLTTTFGLPAATSRR